MQFGQHLFNISVFQVSMTCKSYFDHIKHPRSHCSSPDSRNKSEIQDWYISSASASDSSIDILVFFDIFTSFRSYNESGIETRIPARQRRSSSSVVWYMEFKNRSLIMVSTRPSLSLALLLLLLFLFLRSEKRREQKRRVEKRGRAKGGYRGHGDGMVWRPHWPGKKWGFLSLSPLGEEKNPSFYIFSATHRRLR